MRRIIVITLVTDIEADLNNGVFPDDSRIDNIVRVHKKDLKDTLINYCSTSLLLIFAKIFEKIIFTSMFET